MIAGGDERERERVSRNPDKSRKLKYQTVCTTFKIFCFIYEVSSLSAL